MPNTTIIMPGPCQNGQMLAVYYSALATLKATSNADLIFIDDNPSRNVLGEQMAKYCDTLGYRYHNFGDCEINNAKMYNWGRSQCQTPLVAYANADILFYKNAVNAIECSLFDNPDLYCSTGYAWDSYRVNCVEYRRDTTPVNNVVRFDKPPAWFIMFRTDHDFIWDENIGFWEIDCDLWAWMKANNKIGGICQNARIDHLCGHIRGLHNGETYGGDKDRFMAQGTERFRQKWGMVA